MTVLQIIDSLFPCPPALSQRLNGMIELAEAETGQGYKAFRNQAVALLVCHRLALAERGLAGAAGPITAEAEGDLSRSYGQVQTEKGSAYLQSTIFGMQLLDLRRKLFIGARNRMTPCQ